MTIASCISKPDSSGRITIRCINPTSQAFRVEAGAVVGNYTMVDNADLREEGPEGEGTRAANGTFPKHLTSLLQEGKQRCTNKQQRQSYRALIASYSDIFQDPRGDPGRMSLAEHTVNLTEDLTPPISIGS